MPTPVTSFRLPPDVTTKLKQICDQNDHRSVTETIIKLLREAFVAREATPLDQDIK